MKKKRSVMLLAVCFSMALTMTAFAGSWKKDSAGWWYRENDGSYPRETWKEVDGAWYYFDYDGYMLADTYAPDGYYLGKSGAWDAARPRRVGMEEILNTLYGMEDYSLKFGSFSAGSEEKIGSYVGFMGPGMSSVWGGIAFKYETEDTEGLRVYFEGEGEDEILSVVWRSRKTMDFPEVYYESRPGTLPIEGVYRYFYRLEEN